MAEKLSQLKNGAGGKQKVKKESLKSKAKPGKKEKVNFKVKLLLRGWLIFSCIVVLHFL